ncbi:MAG: hypothetical protein IJP62_04900 [Treponema sp.]|nr:hypothetical protein [Treponema sp.]
MKKSLFFAFIALCVTLSLVFAQKKTAAKKSSDVDLTKMSATMVYAKVFDMLINPDNYEGRKIRMHGTFEVFEYEMDGKPARSFACIVQDATACCAQGMEFRLKGSPVYPKDYPAQYSDITVSGTFHQFEEAGMNRILLTDCTVE